MYGIEAMPRHLPPMTSLKAFEAAGRHLSFTIAARELGVTQAAVSHQIKSLEEQLGAPLFKRLPRKLELTAAGSRLLRSASTAFDEISNALAAIDSNADTRSLVVRLPPTFAARWLLPRLKSFSTQHPEIDLRITHSNLPVDFAVEDIDLAITWGDGKWTGVDAQPVLQLDFFPVCAPDYQRADAPLTDLNNLAHYSLLHDAGYDNWQAWLDAAGVKDINVRRGTVIDDTNVLIRAAIDGQGIALCSSTFIEEHLDSGRLIRPFEQTLHTDLAYYAVCPDSHLRRPPVHAFRSWLIDHAAV